jgi:hypothetical protein
MPFKSDKQRKFMYSQHPTIAKRWTEEEKKVKMVKAVKKHIKGN